MKRADIMRRLHAALESKLPTKEAILIGYAIAKLRMPERRKVAKSELFDLFVKRYAVQAMRYVAEYDWPKVHSTDANKA